MEEPCQALSPCLNSLPYECFLESRLLIHSLSASGVEQIGTALEVGGTPVQQIHSAFPVGKSAGVCFHHR